MIMDIYSEEMSTPWRILTLRNYGIVKGHSILLRLAIQRPNSIEQIDEGIEGQ